MSKRLNFLNKGISTLTGILVISSIAFLAAGFIAYQYWWLSRQEAEMPEVKIPIIEIDKTECQDECSQEELRRCFESGYQICGDYDEDNCLEWGAVIECYPKTTCQNGNCVRLSTFNEAVAALNRDPIDFKELAHVFPLSYHFIKEKDATLFTIAFASLPSHLVKWEADVFEKFIKAYFAHWVQNIESPDFKIEIKKVEQGLDPSIDDLRIVELIFHEYAHMLDKRVTRYPSVALVDTFDFCSISFDMENPYFDRKYGVFYFSKRPSNAYNEFVTKYAAYGMRVSIKNGDGWAFGPWEDFAESFDMYVAQGNVFRELAKLDPFMGQKYNWLKKNVFNGEEYLSGDVLGLELVRQAGLPPEEAVERLFLPAQHPIDYSKYVPDFVWNYRF